MIYKMGEIVQVTDNEQGFLNVKGVIVGFNYDTQEVFFKIVTKGFIGINPHKTSIDNVSKVEAIVE